MDFSGLPEKNLIIITGPNGAGKSTLFNAIGWCFFGQETQVKLQSKKGTDEEKYIPHEDSYDKNGMAKVEVKITLQFPDGGDFYQVSITRQATFQKGMSAPIINGRPEITAYNVYNNTVSIETKNFLDMILPESLASFYLLDAEWLTSYGTKTSIKVSDGILKLFRLDRFAELASALQILADRYNKKRFSVESKSRKNDELRKGLRDLYQRQEDLTILINKKEGEKNELIRERDDAEEEAKKISKVADLFAKYKEQLGKRDGASKDIAKLEKDFLNLKITRSYLLNSKDLLESALESVKNLNKNPTIKLPPDVEPTFVKSLLQSKQCICGRSLGEGTHEHNAVERLLTESSESEKNMYLTELPYKIDNAKLLIGETEKRLEKFDTDREQKAREFEEAEVAMGEILKLAPKELEDFESVEKSYQTLIGKHTTYTDTIRDLDEDLVRKRKDLEALTSQIGDDEAKLKDEKDLSSEEALMLSRAKFASILKESSERFADRAKVKFASLLEEGLNLLLSATPGFEDFSVQIEAQQGGKVLRIHYIEADSERYYLSGGQAEFVGIIIMVAFVKLLERFRKQSLTLPFVLMDNPMHDLDKTNTKRIYESLSNFFKGTQVVVFMPDETYERTKEYERYGLLKVFFLTHKKPERITYVREMAGDKI